MGDKISNFESKEEFEGCVFCFFFLFVKIGFFVYVNGYFELFSNWRDIWYGDDMVGGGKLWVDWNCCFLEDVVVFVYVWLLVEVVCELGVIVMFYVLWFIGFVYEFWYFLLK